MRVSIKKQDGMFVPMRRCWGIWAPITNEVVDGKRISVPRNTLSDAKADIKTYLAYKEKHIGSFLRFMR